MKRKTVVLILSVFVSNFIYSQAIVDSLLQVGNSFYKKQDFSTAGKIWEKAGDIADNKIAKQQNYFYATHAYAEGKDSAHAFQCLEKAVRDNGFNDLSSLQDEETFGFMNKSIRWQTLIHRIKPAYTTDPLKAKILDTDVRNFWIAYDLVQKDSSNDLAIYKDYYLDKGSLALQDYYVNKMGGNVYYFAQFHKMKKEFYKSIRNNTFKAVSYSNEYKKSFVKLKQIYPAAIFPNVYFVIGKLNSAGTSSSNGLILAIDQICKTPTTNTTELATWELHYLSPFSNLPATVAHELIHFQQKGMASDTTLLKAAVQEGMADFMGELISGQSANSRLQQFAKGKEKIIWNKFKGDMFLDRANNWVGNGDQDRPDWPSDLGYWVGYEICQSYFANAKDKKKAIYEMLHIQNYNKFFKDSNFEKVANGWQ